MSIKPLNFRLFAKFEKVETQTTCNPVEYFFHFVSASGPFVVQVTKEQFAAPPTPGSCVWIEGGVYSDRLQLNNIFLPNAKFPEPSLEEQEYDGYFDGVCRLQTSSFIDKQRQRRYKVQLGSWGYSCELFIDKLGMYAEIPLQGLLVCIKGQIKMVKKDHWKFCYPRLHPTDFKPYIFPTKPSAQ